MIPNVRTALRALLLADADVSALVGTRVFHPSLPDAETPFMPRAAVVITAAGGSAIGMGARSWFHAGSSRVDIRSYGATAVQAQTLALAVYEALKQAKRQKLGNCLLLSVMHDAGPFDLIEPEVEWPLTVVSYLAAAAEVAIVEV